MILDFDIHHFLEIVLHFYSSKQIYLNPGSNNYQSNNQDPSMFML